MPGYITHILLLDDAISAIQKDVPSVTSRHVESLLSANDHYRAAVLGSMGPDILELVPPFKSNFNTRSASFRIHNGGFSDLLNHSVSENRNSTRHDTEWFLIQKAYIYGLVAHAVTDSFYYPYIFYSMGLPPVPRRERRQWRFQLQRRLTMIDMFFYERKIESQENVDPLDLGAILPHYSSSWFHLIYTPILSLLASFPETRQIMLPFKGKSNDTYALHRSRSPRSWLDLFAHRLPQTIEWRKAPERPILRKLRDNTSLTWDILVPYPRLGQYDDRVLNLHRDRWRYPGTKAGFLHESVEDIRKRTVQAIVDAWLLLEETYQKGTDTPLPDLPGQGNLFTGEKDTDFFKMEYFEPYSLHF